MAKSWLFDTESLPAADGSKVRVGGTVEEIDPTPPPPLPTAEITLLPNPVEVGQHFTLSWATAGAVTARLVHEGSGSVISEALQGEVLMTATAEGAHTYRLTATNETGMTQDVKTLTVTPAAPPPAGLPLKFDFGTPTSPVMEGGWVGISVNDVMVGDDEFGWLSNAGIVAEDRGVLASDQHGRLAGTVLNTDFCAGRDFTFLCRVPVGTHAVKLIVGDHMNPTVDADLYLQGALVDTWSSQAGYTLDRYYMAACPQGLLTLRLVGRGSQVPLAALEVGGEYIAPDPLRSTHKLDFGTLTSPVQDGYDRGTHLDFYSSQRGRGWESTWGMPGSRDRVQGTPLLRDIVINRDMTFRVDVPPGRYRVRSTHCDVSGGHDWKFYLQGVQQGELVTLAKGQLLEFEWETDAPAGYIRLRMQGYREGGGPDEYAIINALVVEPTGPPPPPMPTATISAAPTTVEAGGQVVLTWETTGAVAASINGSPVALGGSSPTTAPPTPGSYNFVLVATDSLGRTATTTTAVGVTEPSPVPLPTAELTVVPAWVEAGQSVTATWNTTNATAASLRTDLGTVYSNLLSGTMQIPLIAPQTRTFILTATDSLGRTATDSSTVTVTEPPPPPSDIPPNITVEHGEGIAPDYIPDYGWSPTIRTIRDGNWSDPGTWMGNRLPAAGDRANVAHGVLYDLISNERLEVVCVEGEGDLTVHPEMQTRLTCGTFLIHQGGGLWGNLTSGGSFELVLGGATTWPEWDPKQYGQGLINLGRIDLRGPSRGPSWAWTGVGLTAGQTVIPVSTGPVSGWRVGDTIIVPDTRKGVKPADRSEFRTVASANIGSVTLNAPLTYAHPGSGPFAFGVPIANLSRSVVIRSAATGLRGHSLFTGHSKEWLEHIEFRDVGRTTVGPLVAGTNQIGRYSVHKHHGHTHDANPPMHLAGCSVWDTALNSVIRWGVTVHGTCGCYVGNNAVWNKSGWAYGTEMGNEIDNVFEGNFGGAINGYNNNYADPASRGWRNDVGFSGDVFWFRNAGNIVRGNVAVDGFVGFGIYCSGLPSSMLIDGVTRNPKTLQIPDFSGNCALGGRMQDGFTIWELNVIATFYPFSDSPEQFVRDNWVWNISRAGYLNYPTHRLRLINFRVHNAKFWVYGQHYLMSDFLAEGGLSHSNYIGCYTGNQVSTLQPVQEYRRNTFVNSTICDFRVPVKDGASSEASRQPIPLKFKGNLPTGGAVPHIWMDPTLVGLSIDLTNTTTADVEDYAGVVGDNFRAFFHEQRPDYVMPDTNYPSGPIRYGNPRSGWTNAQLAEAELRPYAGSVAPADAVTRTGIVGLTKAVSP